MKGNNKKSVVKVILCAVMVVLFFSASWAILEAIRSIAFAVLPIASWGLRYFAAVLVAAAVYTALAGVLVCVQRKL